MVGPPPKESQATRFEQPRGVVRQELRAIRRRLAIFLFCAITVPAAVFGLSLAAEKKYTATASLLFRDPQFDQRLFGSTSLPSGNLDPDREAATNLKLASLDVVARRTARELAGGLDTAEVAAGVTVGGEGQSNLVSISAVNSDPARAAAIANEYAKQYINFRRAADRAKITDVIQVVRDDLDSLPETEATGPEGELLRSRIQDLRVLSAAQTGNAELVQPAKVPAAPSSPRPFRNAFLGLVIGLIFGALMAIARDRFDRRLRDPSELEEIFGRPVLAVVPRSKVLEDPGPADLPPRLSSAFQMLRINLRYFNASRSIKTLLVTSANVAEGKSTVAWSLARAAGGGETRVLLIEADLRRPSLVQTRRLRQSPGLSGVLSGGAELDDAVEKVVIGGPAPRSFDVLTAGSLPPDPAALIESDAMTALLRTVRDRYDLVILDCPPASIVPDPNALVGHVDGVIVVSGVGRTTRAAAARLNTQLVNLSAPVLGVVINMAPTSVSYDGYGYGYDYEPTNGSRGASATAAR
jgi:capsular exopolysaccharide synthesis family protein